MNYFVLLLCLLMVLPSAYGGLFTGTGCVLCLATYWGVIALTTGVGGAAIMTAIGGVITNGISAGTVAALSGAAGGIVALAAALGPCSAICIAAMNPFL